MSTKYAAGAKPKALFKISVKTRQAKIKPGDATTKTHVGQCALLGI